MGIDPGSVKAGYGLIELELNPRFSTKIIDYGTVLLHGDFFQRIGELAEYFSALASSLEFDELALESLIHVKNINSLSKLAQARGAIIGALAPKKKGNTIFEYSPNAIKTTICGNGHGDKKALQWGLRKVFGPLHFKTDDESDALGIAFCHALHRRQVDQGRVLG